SRLFVPSVVHLVLFLLVVRLFSAHRNRDYYFLAVIAFLMVLAAAVLTVGTAFLFGFALFLLSAVATFILMEMKNASAKAAFHFHGESHSPQNKMALALAGTAPTIVLLVLLGATAIFFALPRMSGGYLSAYASSGTLSTGFSDHVDLGGIGELQQS